MLAISKNAPGPAPSGGRPRCVWAIEMSRQERTEAERRIQSIVLCIMIGLLMGLIVATILVYGRPTRNESHTAWNAAIDRPR